MNRFLRPTYMTTRNETVVTSPNKRPSSNLIFSDSTALVRSVGLTAESTLNFTQLAEAEYVPAPVVRNFQVGNQFISMTETVNYQTQRIFVNENV